MTRELVLPGKEPKANQKGRCGGERSGCQASSTSTPLPDCKKKNTTIDIPDSLVVTHPTTDRTAQRLIKRDRTGTHLFAVIWPIAEEELNLEQYIRGG